MLIECLIKRVGGTHVDLQGVHYHFRPALTGEHVCEVQDENHVDLFLRIPEGYRIARKNVKLAKGSAPDPEPERDPKDRAFLPPGASKHIAEMDRDELFEYAARLGMRKPHPSISDEKLRMNILMVLEEQNASLYEYESDDEDAESDAESDDEAAEEPDELMP